MTMATTTMLHPRYVPSAPSLGLRIEFLLDKVDDVLVQQFGMRELATDPKDAVHEGTWHDDRVGIDARAFAGDGRLARLDVVRGTSLEGTFESLSVFALPRPDLGAPIYALEAVARNGVWSSLQLDLVHVVGGATYAELESLAHDLRTGNSALECTWFDRASDVAIAVGGIVREDFTVDCSIGQYLDAFVARLEGAESVPSEAVRRAQRDFLSDMNRRHAESNAFDVVFGEDAHEFFGRTVFDPTIV